VEIDEDLQKRIHDLFPWGLLGPCLRVIITDVLDMIEEHGEIAIAAMITGKIRARDVLLDRLKKGDGSQNEHR